MSSPRKDLRQDLHVIYGGGAKQIFMLITNDIQDKH